MNGHDRVDSDRGYWEIDHESSLQSILLILGGAVQTAFRRQGRPPHVVAWEPRHENGFEPVYRELLKRASVLPI
jgi:hypothetical protein